MDLKSIFIEVHKRFRTPILIFKNHTPEFVHQFSGICTPHLHQISEKIYKTTRIYIKI